MVSIKGLPKARVLMTLYEVAKPQGIGFLEFVPGPLSESEAQKYVEEYPSFDYLKGRVMKVNIERDSFDDRLFDRDNGVGTAARAIARLREQMCSR